MDILLYIVAFVVIIIGVAGCIVPGIPGPPISYFGLLIIHWTEIEHFDENTLWITGVAMAVVTLLDYIVPIWGTKKYGGSKWGTWGSVIGIFVGLFLGPIGVIIGPFAGAVIGELLYGRNEKEAFRSGMGAFIGFLLGTGLKLAVSGYIAYLYFNSAIGAVKSLF